MIRSIALGVLVAAGCAAHATDLTLVALADDDFIASISTDPLSPGKVFLEQPFKWVMAREAITKKVTLTPGVTNYLNILAWDVYGGVAMLSAQAHLSDSNFFFNDGSQYIVTDVNTNWAASLEGFGGAPIAIEDKGANGSYFWVTTPNLDSAVHRIWTSGERGDMRYFQAAITPVPEPGTMLLVGAGGGALLARLRKRRQSKA